MDAERAEIAHLLKRTTFGPHPGAVERFVGLGRQGAVRALLDTPALRPEPPGLGSGDDERVLVEWWTELQGRPEAGLHEKLVWFWHGHLVSGLDKSPPRDLWNQHLVLREHALGDFRTMLRAVAVDPAMLAYLDGAGSTSEAPNENFARELMELFTIGRGAFTEADVRAGAVACSGWWIDDKGTARFSAEDGPRGPVTFLGRQVAGIHDVVDAVCDHDGCAPFVATRLHTFLVGRPPSDARRAVLGAVFRDSGLQIRPLVEAILLDDEFWEARHARPRFPVEWFAAASAVLGGRPDTWVLHQLGQVPFHPPNPAGWPVSSRWITAGAAFVRAQAAMSLWDDTEVVDSDDPVAAILAKASVFDPSESTVDGLRAAAERVEGRRARASLLHALVVTCPEFVMA